MLKVSDKKPWIHKKSNHMNLLKNNNRNQTITETNKRQLQPKIFKKINNSKQTKCCHTYFVFNCRVMQTGVEHDNREAQYITRV